MGKIRALDIEKLTLKSLKGSKLRPSQVRNQMASAKAKADKYQAKVRGGPPASLSRVHQTQWNKKYARGERICRANAATLGKFLERLEAQRARRQHLGVQRRGINRSNRNARRQVRAAALGPARQRESRETQSRMVPPEEAEAEPKQGIVVDYAFAPGECPICLERLAQKPRVHILPCLHAACESCFDGWRAAKAESGETLTCPTCRVALT